MVFDVIANAVAAAMGISVANAGFILGFVVVIAIVVAVSWALGDRVDSFSMAISGGAGTAFVALAGWWPLWVIIFIGLLVVLVIVDPWGSRRASI